MKQQAHHRAWYNQAGGIIPDKHQLFLYLRKCWSVVTDAAVLLAVTILLYMALLFILRIVWNLYLSTEIGLMFVAEFPEEAASTSQILQFNFITFSIGITLHSFVISLIVGSICRFFHLTGRLYEPFGLVGRTVVCVLPLTALVAFYVRPLYGLSTWDTTFIVVLLPTFMVYGRCFDYAKKLLPEFSDVKSLVGRVLQK